MQYMSRMSQRRQNRSVASAPVDIIELERPIRECVRFIFHREGSKIPIKRAEIVKHLDTVCQTPTSKVNIVLSEANKILKTVYGYKLVQIKVKEAVQYIVALDEECHSFPSSNVVDVQQRLLLIAALTHIYMSGGPIKEDDMWKFFSEAGLLEENDYAGRKAFITAMTKQMYLLYTKVGDGELARNVFEWGQRANEEVPKIFLLQKMAEAFDKSPNYWCEQYREATEAT